MTLEQLTRLLIAGSLGLTIAILVWRSFITEADETDDSPAEEAPNDTDFDSGTKPQTEAQ